jgi:hypothetical protein
MTLYVFTGNLNAHRSHPDALDITRLSGGEVGSVFAPSWTLLNPVKAKFKEANEIAATNPVRAQLMRQAAWSRYAPAYLSEMRRSWVENRKAWDSLLATSRVAGLCYCEFGDVKDIDLDNPPMCHRFLWAGILVKLGAVFCGELPKPQTTLPFAV